MVASFFSCPKCFFIPLVFLSAFSFYLGVNAADNPAKAVTRAFFCFKNKLTYIGCNEAYRLDQSGIIDVPPPATDEYCTGPCLSETERLLDCIDHALSGFVFLNKATTHDIHNMLLSGCGYGSRRGIFNLGDYLQGELNNSVDRFSSLVRFYALVLMSGCFLILFNCL